ncbi:Leu/Phe-tRNA-protein transferase [Bacillus sp. SORGH_AS 510]|uniref:hypothetical protein n=1 Tax=Bacillus sp. SORGH_AS_0510 TaxID=3041771 RepID=UPI0027872CC6|nr:hypothetical protein [Bacillus sp. SORGH_AS_0510]MDQ1147398.1 Leu/Phe-tRNA-protein transferase [Bacillus sp. SORGH_AS_0510]
MSLFQKVEELIEDYTNGCWIFVQEKDYVEYYDGLESRSIALLDKIRVKWDKKPNEKYLIMEDKIRELLYRFEMVPVRPYIRRKPQS